MTLYIAYKSLFSPFPASIALVGYKIPLLWIVSSVYSSCLNVSVVCHSRKKQIIEMLSEF